MGGESCTVRVADENKVDNVLLRKNALDLGAKDMSGEGRGGYAHADGENLDCEDADVLFYFDYVHEERDVGEKSDLVYTDTYLDE